MSNVQSPLNLYSLWPDVTTQDIRTDYAGGLLIARDVVGWYQSNKPWRRCNGRYVTSWHPDDDSLFLAVRDTDVATIPRCLGLFRAGFRTEVIGYDLVSTDVCGNLVDGKGGVIHGA